MMNRQKLKLWLCKSFIGFSVFWFFFALTNMVLIVSVPDSHFTGDDLYGTQAQVEKNTLGTLICDGVKNTNKKDICVQLDENGEFMYFIYDGRVINGGERI